MIRSAAGFETTVASTVSAQSSSDARAERDLGAIEVDVVAGPQLGEAGLAGAEAQRRRRADRELVERDAGRGRAIAAGRSASRLHVPRWRAARLPTPRW